ncbi:MAG: hypothetical protein JNG88_02210 [Phycisphaerales bacterium]|nr:hypothetical protein [Phycisphaerales bacterium]
MGLIRNIAAAPGTLRIVRMELSYSANFAATASDAVATADVAEDNLIRENPPASIVRVLDVGNCDPDHAGIKWVIEGAFQAQVDRVMFVPDALRMMRETHYALVLVNRLIFEDQSEGIELIRAARADASLAAIPIMMVSNLPAAQETAVAAGAAPGFGKARLGKSDMLAALEQFLPKKQPATARKD